MQRFLRIVSLFFLVALIAPAPIRANTPPESPEATVFMTQLNTSLSVPHAYYHPVALRTLYEARGYAPIWNVQAPDYQTSLMAFLDGLLRIAESNGLEDQTPIVQRIKDLAQNPTAVKQYRVELALTDWLIKLAYDLNGSSIDLRPLYPGWEFNRPATGLALQLGQSLAQNNPFNFLVSLAPHDVDYLRHIEALKLYRAIQQTGGWPKVSPGPTLKPGMGDQRVAQVRARLEAEAYTVPVCMNEADKKYYSDDLKSVVEAYQLRNGLEADGNIGAKTIAAMNERVAKRIDQIRATMARLRILPREWPARYAIVNSADASVKFIENSDVVYYSHVIVGRPDRKTPFINSELSRVIFNPSWHVPTKIAREDILPKLRKDPHYLEKQGIRIRDNEDDPYGAQIDWNLVSKSEFSSYRLRQVPGDLNAMGRIKFDFDNPFSVYMHGTPHQELFAKPERHLSSGCIRLMEPERVAEMVLADNEGEWTREKIEAEVDKDKTHWFNVANPLPLFVVYQTSFFPSEDTSIYFRPDVYGYDRSLLAAMQESEKL